MVFGIKTDSDQRAVKWEIRNKKNEVKEVKHVGGEGQDSTRPTLELICRKSHTQGRAERLPRAGNTLLNFVNTPYWNILIR